MLKIENVNKNYSGFQALTDINLEIAEGSIFGLLGPNGAGKTTLIRIINQITAPDTGKIFLNGETLQRKHVEMIGYLPEERGLYKKMLVGEQALYLAQLKGLPKTVAMKRLKEWFIKFEIENWWDKKIEELSKGMQQKIQFIVTILHQPKLLIFDEPFSGFDPINTNLLKNEILNLKKAGSTIIFSTHNMGSVEEICDEIALINKSQKILDGKVKDIRNSFKKNIFEVEYHNQNQSPELFLPNDFKVLNQIATDDDRQKIEVKIPSNLGSNDLLEIFIKHSKVSGLREIIPGMNDIFIEMVNNKSN